MSLRSNGQLAATGWSILIRNEQRTGELLGRLLQVLENQASNIDKLCDFLETKDDTLLTPLALKAIVADNRNHLLFDLLQRLHIITVNSEDIGYVIPKRIDWLRQHLYLVLGVTQTTHEEMQNSSSIELAWTLPQVLNTSDLTEPVSRSLASLIKHGITKAKEELFLVSPFLDLAGAELLAGSLQGAWRRGVQVHLISHGPSPNTEAVISVYRNAAPNIRIFYAPTIETGEKYLLLHAKLVIADEKFAVLGSANLTSYGLGTHLEIGLGLEGPVVLQLRKLVDTVLASDLVDESIG